MGVLPPVFWLRPGGKLRGGTTHAPVPGRREHAHVASTPQIRLTLVVDEVEPLSGKVEPPSGPTQPFSGWAGLAAALDRAMGDGVRDASSTEEEAQPGR
jgi:hypothetical protein